MKLSDILGWIKKQPLITGQGANNRNKDVQFCRGFNTALTSCDREIDREELAIIIMDMNFESYGFSHEEVAYKTADHIISTIPTWLRKVDGK